MKTLTLTTKKGQQPSCEHQQEWGVNPVDLRDQERHEPFLRLPHQHAKLRHPDIFVGIVEHGTVFASSESSHLSTDQGHVVTLPDVRRILNSIHALDQSANFVFTIFLTIFCWKTDLYESLGCSLECGSVDAQVSGPLIFRI